MSLLPPPLRQILQRGVARLRAGVVDLAILALIGLCLLAAAGFGLSAIHSLLRPMLGSVGASAIVAAGLLVLALVLALWLSLRRGAQHPAAAATHPPVTPAHPDPAAAPLDKTSLAFLVGFLLARKLF